MSEKFEQKIKNISENALHKVIEKTDPFEHAENIQVESSEKEFENNKKYREIMEGGSYIDMHEEYTDIAEETVGQALDIIGKLIHKNEMIEKILKEEQFKDLGRIIKTILYRKHNLTQNMHKLEEQGLKDSDAYANTKNQYEKTQESYNRIKQQAQIPDGNLVDIIEKNLELKKEISDREKVFDLEDIRLN